MVSVVAHDLRNPLTSSLSISQLLKNKFSESKDEEAYEGIHGIERALERMNAMIGKILDLRTIEAHTLEVRWQPTDMTVLAEAVVESMQSQAEAKQIKLDFEEMEEDSRVEVDRDYLTQILENLLSNAIKFSPPHTKVKVCVFPDGNSICTSVCDQGPGISEQFQTVLFQKFQKLNAKPTGGETSTGLGLSIVKKYTEAMRGTVTCQSEEGRGACFTICFPRWYPKES